MILSTHGVIASQIQSFVGLLDTYPNAAAAYSLRKLRAAYTGSAIRVRRTDLTESDIGFTSAGNLDTAALLAFTGTGALNNGFITTWYDQSGNARNATQTTALNQPQIVSAGSVLLQNTKPTISWLSGASGFSFSTFTATSVTMYMVIRAKNDPPTDPNSGFVKFGTAGGSGSLNHYPYSDGIIYDDSFSTAQNTVGNPSTPLNQLNLYNVLSIPNQWTSRINSVQQSQRNTNTVAINSAPQIGSKNASFGLNAFMSELIIYPSDQSSNRTGIETNINNFYSIY
jgi:hypothetical protein